MLTAVQQRSLDEGARVYDRLDLSKGWVKLLQTLRDRGASGEVIATVKRHQKDFRQHVDARNLIAHAGCVGTLRSDPDYLVFAPFEAFGSNELLVVAQPIQVIERSTRWARAVAEMANRILEASGH